MAFTMMDPPGIVWRKSIKEEMFPHDILCLSFPVSTLAAWTENSSRSFSILAPRLFQEFIGVLNPLRADSPPGPLSQPKNLRSKGLIQTFRYLRGMIGCI
jgi:hypothetical protein